MALGLTLEIPLCLPASLGWGEGAIPPCGPSTNWAQHAGGVGGAGVLGQGLGGRGRERQGLEN